MMGVDPLQEIRGHLDELERQRDRALKEAHRKPDELLATEAKLPLTINGIPPAEFIKRAYGLGVDLAGPGRVDMNDPVQAELRRIKDWVVMAEHDALQGRSA